MTSTYIDHRAVLGADEKPILNRFQRMRVASTPIPRTYNEENQLSAAPTKRKNKYSKASVGINITTGKPYEIFAGKEPLSYQNVKYEDDNFRFLATGERHRAFNPNDRRYEKFQTATQRISALNVHPDGTPRTGNIGDSNMDALINLAYNPAIQSTLGNTIPPPVAYPYDAGSVSNLSFGPMSGLLDDKMSNTTSFRLDNLFETSSLGSMFGVDAKSVDINAERVSISSAEKRYQELESIRSSARFKENAKSLADKLGASVDVSKSRNEVKDQIKDAIDKKKLELVSLKKEAEQEAQDLRMAKLAAQTVDEVLKRRDSVDSSIAERKTPSVKSEDRESFEREPSIDLEAPLLDKENITEADYKNAVDFMQKIQQDMFANSLQRSYRNIKDGDLFNDVDRAYEIINKFIVDKGGNVKPYSKQNNVALTITTAMNNVKDFSKPKEPSLASKVKAFLTPEKKKKSEVSKMESKENEVEETYTDKEIENLIVKVKKNSASRYFQAIADIIGRDKKFVSDALETPNGQNEIVELLKDAKKVNEPKASTISSAMQALEDFYNEVPDKVSNYQKKESQILLSKALDIFTDPDNWKKNTGLTKEEINEGFQKFSDRFTKPATLNSKAGNTYAKIEYIRKVALEKKTRPSAKLLKEIRGWDSIKTNSMLDSLAEDDLSMYN